jgi:hypothetical protein
MTAPLTEISNGNVHCMNKSCSLNGFQHVCCTKGSTFLAPTVSRYGSYLRFGLNCLIAIGSLLSLPGSGGLLGIELIIAFKLATL